MIPNLMTWVLLAGVLVIVFVSGYQIGRLAEQDAHRARAARRTVPLRAILEGTGGDLNRGAPEPRLIRHDPPWAACRTCGATPGAACVPQGRRRVPTPRSSR
jgi:hypothetical protein